jgi:hypothetical protein
VVFVIEAAWLEHRPVQIVNVNRILHRAVAKFAAANHQHILQPAALF